MMSVTFFQDSIRELRLKEGGMSAAMLYVYQVQSPQQPWCCTACLILYAFAALHSRTAH